MAKIEVENLFKIFGPANKIEEALQLCQEGKPAGEVSEETGCTAAVYDVTFNVEGAVIFVIMGLSGSGKSTLMRCVNRLIEPTAGKVLIDDENVLDLDHKSILKLREKKMSMVFQHFGLMPHKTVLENAVFGLELSGVAADERDKKGRETLEMVGLEDYADSEVGELSGGMQQRVGLARALATDAEILLMDEAFSALDPLIRTEMQEELLELQKKLPKTILFITHDLGEALMLGDKIAIMKSGEVVQIGTPEEIVLNPENEYVASFVENVDRSRVLTVETAVGDTQPVIDLSDSVRKAIDTMEDQGIEFLLVLEDERPEGFIRLNDAEKEAEKENPQLKNIIQPAEVSVKPDEQLIAVLNKITEAQPLLPVMDENGRMKGVLTKDKLLRAIAGGNK
jgi:glycine betaine/proline transport system ATP-binding protein